MSRSIEAHFDGKSFIPHEPVDAPINQTIRIVYENGAPATNGLPDAATIAQRRARMRRAAGCISAPPLTSQQMSRDVIYDDDLP